MNTTLHHSHSWACIFQSGESTVQVKTQIQIKIQIHRLLSALCKLQRAMENV